MCNIFNLGHQFVFLCHKIFQSFTKFVSFCSINVSRCFDQFYGHPQTARTHETKITIENVISGQNEILVLCTMHKNTIYILIKNNFKVKYEGF